MRKVEILILFVAACAATVAFLMIWGPVLGFKLFAPYPIFMVVSIWGGFISWLLHIDKI